MEKHSSVEKQSTSSRTNSTKDLSASHSSIKSNKSLDNQSNSVNKSVTIEPDKDKDKDKENIHLNKQGLEKKNTVPLDGTTKIPHKFITNWRLACDRTKDRTKELLKRWKTLSEFEGLEHAHHADKEIEKKECQTNDKSGWSVHVWSKFFKISHTFQTIFCFLITNARYAHNYDTIISNHTYFFLMFSFQQNDLHFLFFNIQHIFFNASYL